MSEIERERGREFADKLTLGVLARAWQILLKGVEDVKDSPRPLASAEMALIRLAYASDLPTPEEAIRKLSQATEGPRHAPPLPSGGGGPRASMRLAARKRLRLPPPLRASAPPPPPSTAPRLASFRRRRRARAGQARYSARPVARTGRAARAFRTGQHRLHARRRRQVRTRADAEPTIAGMDRASAGWWRWSPGSTTPTLREAAAGARGRASEQRRVASAGAKGS